MKKLNGRISFNLVKSHELICHFIRGYLVPPTPQLPHSSRAFEKGLPVKHPGFESPHSLSFGLYVIRQDLLFLKTDLERYTLQCTKYYSFISSKVCLLTSIEDKRQTLPEINMHARLFGTLEYEFNSIREFGSLVKIVCCPNLT